MSIRRHLSLRTRLVLMLGLGTLLPLSGTYLVGLMLTLGRLEGSLKERTQRTVEIARNVLLRQVQQISGETARMAADPELRRLLPRDPRRALRHLKTSHATRGLGLVQLVEQGQVAPPLPGEEGQKDLGVREGAVAVARARDYERYVTLMTLRGRLVVRAAAPVLDDGYVVRGVVVITTPLDSRMADFVKGVVQAEVGFVAGGRPLASTYVDSRGARLPGQAPPAELGRQVRDRRAVYLRQRVGDSEYSVAFARLQSVEGQYVGMLSVGVSRQGLSAARLSASGFLALGALIALLIALLIASGLAHRITTPLARLHRSVRAVAAGDLEQEVAAETDDEIGDLALAFQSMTAAIKTHRQFQHSHQEQLESQVHERTAELARANERLEQLARTDGLTELFNHRHFQGALVREVERSHRSQLPLSMLMIDVDHFKHYNDENGHMAGDAVLKEVAQLLAGGRRLNDVVARYGGEEFAVLLLDTPRESAAALAEQLRSKVEQAEMKHEQSQPGGRLTISVGVATCPADATTPDSLVAAADAALYRAKRKGRNCVKMARTQEQEQTA